MKNMDKSKEFFVGDINKRELIYSAHLIYLGEVQKRAKREENCTPITDLIFGK